MKSEATKRRDQKSKEMQIQSNQTYVPRSLRKHKSKATKRHAQKSKEAEVSKATKHAQKSKEA